ncbi:MAG TPA: lanthionine synthetase C family protein [Streptosporangiaceae bacterium]
MHAAPVSGAPVIPQMTGAPRQALLSGALRDEALQLAGRLNTTLRPVAAAGQGDASLASGSAGLAVCSGQFARTRADQQAAEAALTHLEVAADAVVTSTLSSSLYSGFVGVAWAVELVDRLLGSGGEGASGDIDDALARLLRRYPQDAPYDLTSGLTGLGVYALTCWPRLGAVQCALEVVEQLARRARHDRDGIFWVSPQRHDLPGRVDLGVAHGIAGVIAFLARAHRLGLARQAARPLLDGAVSWLLAHLVDTPAGPTVPYLVAEGVAPAPARSAWCHGDPGLAIALLLAARDVAEPAWAAVATGLAVRAAVRPPYQSGVADAGLCHGSAGLAHLFNRLHQMTAEPVLADAARFWIERTLELCGTAGPAYSGTGLLEGAAGVALAMEAASTTAEPVWDQMLLVSAAGIPGVQAQ